MFEFMVAKVQAWIASTRETYGVDPVVFLVISTVNAPFFYFTIYKSVKAVAKRDTGRLPLWATLFLVSVVVPYVYVLFWGRNLPWYIYAAMGLLVAQGVWTLVKKVRRKGPAKGRPEGPPPGNL
jgi:hypothetical protein